MHIEKLAVIGVGLIGSSCALALRAAGAVSHVVGVGRSADNLERARSRGAIDEAVLLDDAWTQKVADVDLVLIAIPVAQYRDVLSPLADVLHERTVVTDAGSTKQDVVLTAREVLKKGLPRFVPGHPVAGSERSGAEAGEATLFVGRQVILTPLPETSSSAVALVADFWTACGARVARLDAVRHDRIMAAVSHLPHLLASALVAELASRKDSAEYLGNAGSGFRDFTRIAAAPPEMWRDIALANREALLTELATYRTALDAVALSIEHGDGAALLTMLLRATEARRNWSETAGGIAAVPR